MINLAEELTKAYNADAWHGSNILDLLLTANPQKVFTHPIPNAHSIAEITLHLTAWTEEVIDQIGGDTAKEPLIGDWPKPKEHSEEEWNSIISDFKKANQKLIASINGFESSNWTTKVIDQRNRLLGTGVNNGQLTNGLIQHHAYHAGQIALLIKF